MRVLITSLPDLRKINLQRPHYLIEKIAEQNQVTILCVNAWWLDSRYDDTTPPLPENVEFKYLCDKPINPFIQEIYGILKFRKLIDKSELQQYDIHIDFNSVIFGLYVCMALKRYDIKTLFDVCDDLPELTRTSPQIPFLLKSIAFYLSIMLMNATVRHSNIITYVTEALKRSYNFPPERSVLIPNGVCLDKFIEANRDYNRYKYGFDNDVFIVGFIGYLSEWVDLEPVLSAVRKLADENLNISLLIIGGGERLSYYQRVVKDQDLSECVIFTGSTNHASGAELISCMDIGLICRKSTQDSQNSLPIKLFEYWACNKPVISTPLSGVKEFAGDLVYYASTSEEYYEIIRELYWDKRSRTCEELGKSKGFNLVRSKYNWDIIGADFLKIVSNNKSDE